MSEIWLITGGVRAGKSRLAGELAGSWAAESGASVTAGRVTYLATAERGDEEMAARIAAHQASRPAEWGLVEEPLALGDGVARATEGCLIVDCLTLWVSNRAFPVWPAQAPSPQEVASMQDELLEKLAAAMAAMRQRQGPSIVVTNEVGLGVIADDAAVRAYGDLLGAVNASIAGEAERVYLCLAGLSMELKSLGARGVGK